MNHHNIIYTHISYYIHIYHTVSVAPAYLISTNSLQQVIFTLTTPDGSYKCILSTNETNLSNSVGLEHAAIRCDNNHIIESASSNGDDFCDPCNTTMPW